jgi:hypothetical protein
MNSQYANIISKLKEAREAGNTKTIKTWKTKLANWQNKYGAYAPVTQSNVHIFE